MPTVIFLTLYNDVWLLGDETLSTGGSVFLCFSRFVSWFACPPMYTTNATGDAPLIFHSTSKCIAFQLTETLLKRKFIYEYYVTSQFNIARYSLAIYRVQELTFHAQNANRSFSYLFEILG